MYNNENLGHGKEMNNIENVEKFKIDVEALETTSVEEKKLYNQVSEQHQTQESINLIYEQVQLNLKQLFMSNIINKAKGFDDSTPTKLNSSMNTITTVASTGPERYKVISVSDEEMLKAYKLHLLKLKNDIDLQYLSVSLN